jgi:hypothetical protein
MGTCEPELKTIWAMLVKKYGDDKLDSMETVVNARLPEVFGLDASLTTGDRARLLALVAAKQRTAFLTGNADQFGAGVAA